MTKQESAQQTASLGSPALGFATSLDDDPALDPFAHLFADSANALASDSANALPADALPADSANALPADSANAPAAESTNAPSADSANALAAESTRTFADDARATSQAHSLFDSEDDLSLASGSPAPSGIYSLGIRTSSGELQQIRQQGLRTTILPRLQKLSE